MHALKQKISVPWFKETKPLIILGCSLLMCMLVATTVAYKIINVFGWSANAASLIFTLSFPINVLIAEVYGSTIGKFVTYTAMALAVLFSLIVSLVVHLPAPVSVHYDDAFRIVLGNSARFSIVGAIASLIAFRINIAVITHFKRITQGRWFVLRYLGSTTIGEFALATIATFGAFIFVVPISQVVQIWLFSYCVKVITTIILAWPTSVLAIYIKNISGMDVY